jgi:membrane-associated phospholipid phosphatase
MIRFDRSIAAALIIAAGCCCSLARAQTPDPGSHPADEAPRRGLLVDIEDYYTSPLRWDLKDWGLFGGTLAAVALAHHYDSDVRTHFVKGSNAPLDGSDPNSLKDFAPTAVVLGGTLVYSWFSGDRAAHTAAWGMAEAGGLALVTNFGLKYAFGRLAPNETTDPNKWRSGGSSFPSNHVTAAFAVGTVFAESGSDDYRWVTRFVGYGMAVGTGYLRLEHNQHWLSDVVAGAALGTASAFFVLHRTYPAGLTVVPIERGVMVAFHTDFEH